MRINQHAAQRMLTLLLPCMILCMMQGSAFGKGDSVPDWVKDASKETLPPYPPNTDAVMLLSDETYTVDSNGKAVKHVMEVIKILRPQGREYGEVHVQFNNDSKIKFIHVWSIGPDGHEYAVKDSDIIDMGSYSDSNSYDDLKFKFVNAPASDPGAIVAYEYEQKCPPYLNENDFFIQQEIPIHDQRITLQLAPGFEYKDVWKDHAAISATALGNNAWQWKLKDMPGVNLENVPMAPSTGSLVARMTIHYFGNDALKTTRGDWKSEGQLLTQLNSDRIIPDPSITAKAQQLTAGMTDFYDKAMTIGQYVQKFRYYAIELGIGGLQPHFASDIFKHNYGDCKDKATVLTAMLSAVGIHAVAVIVDINRGVISPDDPSQIGDHEIAAIEIPAGYNSPKLHTVVTTQAGKHYLIFDPTADFIPFGDIEYNLQGSYGLLADGDQSQIIQIPVLAPSESRAVHHGKFSLNADGSLTGTVSASYFGDESEIWREVFILGGEKQRSYVEKWLGEFFPSFTLNSYSGTDFTALNQDMQLHLDFKATGYARQMGPLLLVRPRVVGSIAYPLDTKSRKYPIELDEGVGQITDDYQIDLPAGYAVDDLPDPVKLDTGFASYESKTEVKGNTLHYTRTFEMRAVELPADKYADLRHLMESIGNDERSEVVLKKLP